MPSAKKRGIGPVGKKKDELFVAKMTTGDLLLSS